MSVIAYRGGIIAADTRAYLSWNTPSPGAKSKIRRLGNGTLIGVSTAKPGGGEVLMDWFAAGANPMKTDGHPDEFTLLAVTKDGQAHIYCDNVYPTGPIDAVFFAIGSGAEYALGAMYMGASAEDAVHAACRFDAMCALPTRLLQHEVSA